MRSKQLLTTSVLMLSLSGCAGAAGIVKPTIEVGASLFAAWRSMRTERVVERLVQIDCVWTKVIRPTEAEFVALSVETQRQIVAHNAKWEENCRD